MWKLLKLALKQTMSVFSHIRSNIIEQKAKPVNEYKQESYHVTAASS